MRFDKQQECTLVNTIDRIKSFKGKSLLTITVALCIEIKVANPKLSRREVMESAMALSPLYQALSLNHSVECISSTVIDEAETYLPKLLEATGDNSLFQEVGGVSTVFSLKDYVVLCSVQEDNCCFEVHKKGVYNSVNWWQLGQDVNLKDLFNKGDDDEYEEIRAAIRKCMAVLLFKKYAEVRETIIATGARRHLDKTSEAIWNRLPFQIKYVDTTWYTTIVRKGDFPVKAHCRWCPKSQRLTFIHTFMKHGYVRKAQKLLYA